MTVHYRDLTLDWLGYATLRIETDEGFVAYLDPGRYGVLTGEWEPDTPGVAHPPGEDYAPHDADLVCVTHDHHYDSDGIERVATEDTLVVAYEAVDAATISRDVAPVEAFPRTERVGYGESVAVDGANVRAVTASNDPDGPHTRENGEPYHPEGFGCGFALSMAGEEVLWTGDSDVLPDHEAEDPTLLVPPIGGSFTMDRHGAATLAETLAPDLVLPIHYNTFAALEADSGAFAADAAGRGVPVVLDER
ncbi:MBL fold metallo-hydrolase [Halomarina ordinaria]|uniref:MBL fold metallo-hydrolase n=1 Tax=Halomarina ordinaria TaxID=3033939 RepID=A0ABD5U4X8_9EURY|nr:MBL fold metallo-hydrolase [Halomarina sp. PSRA2]